MKVGVPKEIKDLRAPRGSYAWSRPRIRGCGPQRDLETSAGAGATDDNHRKAGASTFGSAREIFASSDMIAKVKEPQPLVVTEARK